MKSGFAGQGFTTGFMNTAAKDLQTAARASVDSMKAFNAVAHPIQTATDIGR
jgi:hypothetical protein